jgi:tetratricopeptide (TPR) repeat protein
MRNPGFIPVIFLMLLVTACAPKSHLLRGKEYLERNKHDRAIKELEQSANEKGDLYYYIDTYSSLGDAYAGNGQANQAMSVYRNALQMIHLRLREISSQRMGIRRELNSRSKVKAPGRQDEDMRLGDEEWKLKERAEDIKNKLESLAGKQ